MKNVTAFFSLISVIGLGTQCYGQVAPQPMAISTRLSEDLKNKIQRIEPAYFIKDKTLSDVKLASVKNSIVTDVTASQDGVNLYDEIEKVFDPQNHPCALAPKVKKKLQENEDKAKKHDHWTGWTPTEVKQNLKSLFSTNTTVSYLSGKSLNYRLHLVSFIQKKTGKEISTLLANCPTFNGFDFQNWMLPGAATNFIYTLDCSGYVNVAINASGGLPAAEVSSAVNTAMTAQNSMFVAGGLIVSPLTVAYTNQIILDTPLRIAILKSILDIPEIADSDIVNLDLAYDAVAVSRSGKSSFNGEVDLSGKAGATIGIAQINAVTKAGASISRNSTFTDYNTYLLKDNVFYVPNDITVAKIKALVVSLQGTQKTSTP